MRHHVAIMALPTFVLAAQALGEGEQADALQDELSKTLNRYIKALQDGDVQTYRELRDSEYLKREKEFLAKKGRELTSDRLEPRNPKVYAKLTSYPVIEAVERGPQARLALLNENTAEMRHKAAEVEIVFVMFKKEAGVWKLVRFGPLVIPRTDLIKEKQFPQDKVPAPFRIS